MNFVYLLLKKLKTGKNTPQSQTCQTKDQSNEMSLLKHFLDFGLLAIPFNIVFLKYLPFLLNPLVCSDLYRPSQPISIVISANMTNIQPNIDLLSKVTEAARVMSSIKEIYAERDYYKMELNRERLRRQTEAKAKAEKEQETLKQITDKYEDTIDKIRKDHQLQNQSHLKTISEKDRKMLSLSTLNSQLQHNFSMHETEIQSIRSNLINKEQKKLLSTFDEQLKKMEGDTQNMKKNIEQEIARLGNQINSFEADSIRYRKERDDYRNLYERAEARIKDQSCQITELSFQIEKLKLERQQVEICLALEDKPQEKEQEDHFHGELEESTKMLKQIVQNIRERKEHCLQVEKLHKQIGALTQQNSELRKTYLQKCNELDTLRSQINPRAYQQDLALRNPSVLQYLNAKRQDVEGFQKDLKHVYSRVEQIRGLMNKFQSKDITKNYSLTQEIDSLKKMVKTIISFYRNFLQSMYFEFRKQRKGGKKQQQVKAQHICCRCSTPLNRLATGSISQHRCSQCKNQTHDSCVAQDFPSYFACMGIKDILRDDTP